MPQLRPLRALRYGRDHRAQLPELVSPATRGEPTLRAEVGDVHELNVRHLVRGARGPLAGEHEPPFTHAARLMARWKEDGVLVRDPRPALYRLDVCSEHGRLQGLVGLVRLHPWGSGGVLPHEQTVGNRGAELLEQLDQMRAQLSLVMALIPDDDGALADWLAIDHGPPVASVVDGRDLRSELRRDEDPERHKAILTSLKEQPAVIADGHHRWAAALKLQERVGGAATRERPVDYALTMLVPADSPGLVCLPTHRVATAWSADADAALEAALLAFHVAALPDGDAIARWLSGAPGRIGVARGDRWLGLTPRDQALDATGLPAELRRVESAWAQPLLLDPLDRALPDGLDRDHNHRTVADVLVSVAAGDAAAAILLPPPGPRAVVAAATAGLLLPPKSTNFGPKPPKGLVMASLASF